VVKIWVLAVLFACGATGARMPSGTAQKEGIEITLYRDHAVVAHRLDVVIPAAAPAKIKLRIAAGVDPDDVYLVEKSELVVREVRLTGTQKAPVIDGCDEVSCVLDNYERACCAKYERKPSEWDEDVLMPLASNTPVEIELLIGGPREGKYSLLIGYDTPRLAWDAAYTMTTPPTHDRVQLHGAIAIRNATGIAFPDAKLQVVDTQHGPATQRIAAQLGSDPNATPTAAPRELGRATLVEGDTRVELIADSAPRPMRSVLVFDAVGPGLDYQHGQPVQDPNLGVNPPPSTRVTESFEIDRVAATQRLPGGPVRLLERRPDGTLSLLGEAKLFGPSTLAASVDTIPIGTAGKVTGKRERRELTIDNDRKRVVEEIALTVENAREQPVEVVLREHLYRGENWTIAYRSVFDIAKEGKQQIAMRVAVPARGKQTVLYVVVYSWEEKKK
jgi:hypothetical protein